MGFFDKLREGLAKTKFTFGTKVDEELLETLEEQLIIADTGFETTEEIISSLREKIKKDHITETEDVKQALKDKMLEIFEENDSKLHLDSKPSVLLMIGVNGAGKTTTIGKIAAKLKMQGKKVLVAAGDTFRAAAVEQLEEWVKRAGVDIIKGQEGADPASVIFDACTKAKNENYDCLIIDTAGRLQSKKYLMDELEKMKKVIDRELPESDKETILVLDGSIGQNAVSQVISFNECTGITGLIITKLDGTPKGGIVIRIVKENKIPVKFIGVGERLDDMEEFNPQDFVNAIIE